MCEAALSYQCSKEVVMRMETTLKLLVLLCTLVIAKTKAGDLTTCSRNYDKEGCYDEYNPGIKDLIVFDRYGIQWDKIEAYMHNLACKCEAKARALNKERSQLEKYVGFALHFWGECYGRTQAQLNSLPLRSKSGRCTGDKTFTKCYDKNPECTGHAFSEFVFTIRPQKGESRTVIHCTNDVFRMTCSGNLEVTVAKVSYGEITGSVCGKPLSVGWKPECGKVDSRIVSKYYTECLGKPICEIRGWTEDPLDPCPRVSKYLKVQYICNPQP